MISSEHDGNHAAEVKLVMSEWSNVKWSERKSERPKLKTETFGSFHKKPFNPCKHGEQTLKRMWWWCTPALQKQGFHVWLDFIHVIHFLQEASSSVNIVWLNLIPWVNVKTDHKKFVARLFQCLWNLIFRQPFRTKF